MNKKAALILISFFTITSLQAKQPIIVEPSLGFSFRCFLDNLSIPTCSTALSLGLGFWCLKNSIKAWAECERTTVKNGAQHERIHRATMLDEAKKYGKASCLCFAAGTLIHFRRSISRAALYIPKLLLRKTIS